MDTQTLVWLITGASSGLGRDLVLAVLERGDKVIATARAGSLHKLEDLKEKGADVLELDVTSPVDTLKQQAENAVAIHSRIDVLVNNAGYCLAGTVEEVTSEETYDLFNTHVLGPMNVTRAFLPHMRPRRTGTLVFSGSLYSHTSEGALGIYAATKHALRAMVIGLHDEISQFGLRATCIDFGYFRTPVFDPGHRVPEIYRVPDYKELVEKLESLFAQFSGKQPGDPHKAGRAIVDLVRGEGLATGKLLPTAVCLGPECYQGVKEASENKLKSLEEWKDLSYSTNYD
ncbi:hypothetical protein BJ165DRAFT_1389033 [Panaeolus papilionaceus]|nr:hypothetical protein BJ165DRAFT_1389033 [Panaeolus papilionaceus]